MAEQLIKKSMRLFGLPYQFTDAVDPRLDGVSNSVGNHFLKNMILEGPICTIIPGEPNYLPSESTTDKKVTTTAALLESATDGFSNLKDYISQSTNDDLRIYDFKRAYTEYMKYVNILCRAGATFLELEDILDETPLQSYDWRNYRQNSSSYSTIVGKAGKSLGDLISRGVNKVKSTITGKTMLYETTDSDEESTSTIEDQLANHNYVQFYVDPDSSCSENMSNSTSESQLKSMLDNGSNFLKELAFMANSGGVDTSSFTQFTEDAASGLNTGIQTVLGNSGGAIGTAGTALSRVINLGGEVIKGNNIIMPDIYQTSEYSKSYQLTVHLKCPYGSKLGYYMDIFVPMCHLLALALPRQQSANSFGSPFLVKAYIEGSFTCNMGIVSSIQISRSSEAWSVDGLPTEVDVTLEIADLYSDLSISPQSSPIMFVNNSSLIEFLATNCGLSLTTPNMKLRAEMTINTLAESAKGITNNISSGILEAIDNQITNFTGLTW